MINTSVWEGIGSPEDDVSYTNSEATKFPNKTLIARITKKETLKNQLNPK
jgi:hypothetical protein